MKCLHPFRKRIGFKDIDGLRTEQFIEFPCGHCLNCRINYTRVWTQRLLHESYFSDSAWFCTFTYEDEFLPRDDNDNQCVSKRDVQLFFKRLRKEYPSANIRYFLGSEYSPELLRPHYHAIIYNLPEDVVETPCKSQIDLPKKEQMLWHYHDGENHRVNRKLNDFWKKGFIEIDPITRGRVSYCAKYFIDRKNIDPDLVPNFNLMSRKPGLGFQRIAEISDKVRYNHSLSMLSDLGTYTALPRFYKDKIYTEDERSEFFQKLLKRQREKDVVFDPRYREENISMIERNIEFNMTFKGKKRKNI